MSSNTNAKALRLLRAARVQAGSENKWAKANGISQQHVNHVLNERRQPGPQILAALGIARVTVTRITRAKERA